MRGEIFNSVTHMAGSVFAVIGFAVLLMTAAHTGDPWKVASFSVYGATLVALYLFSTLYHSVSGTAKRIFRKLDYTSIYLLIAGTYTPFSLVSLRGPWGYSLFGIVWALATAGILQEFLLRRRIRALSVSLCLFMGWLALAVFFPLKQAIGGTAMAWLFAGGILYTTGVFFYLVDERYAHSHGVFHLFVLGGSAIHFFVVLFFVAAIGSRTPSGDFVRFVGEAERPLEAALADFDWATGRGDAPAQGETARRALESAVQARDRLEARAVPEELAASRSEELLFLNHVVPAFRAYLSGPGGPTEVAKLRSILARGRAHQRRWREHARGTAGDPSHA